MKSPIQHHASGTLLQRLWPALQDAFPQQAEIFIDTALPHVRAGQRLDILTLERLSADWVLPQLPPGPQPRTLPIASYEPVSSDAGSVVEQAVCEVLRSLARQRRLPASDSEQLAQPVHERLLRLGCPPALTPERIAQGVALLQSCLDDARLQWIFKSLNVAEAAAEVPLALTGMFAGRLTSVRADVSFKDAAGSRWLIDIAPLPRQAGAVVSDAVLAAAFELRLAQHIQLADALGDAPARAAIYVPARQLFWSGPGA